MMLIYHARQEGDLAVNSQSGKLKLLRELLQATSLATAKVLLVSRLSLVLWALPRRQPLVGAALKGSESLNCQGRNSSKS